MPPHRRSVPVEIYRETVWEVHDPNLARPIAIFTNEHEARAYARAVNAELEAKSQP